MITRGEMVWPIKRGGVLPAGFLFLGGEWEEKRGKRKRVPHVDGDPCSWFFSRPQARKKKGGRYRLPHANTRWRKGPAFDPRLRLSILSGGAKNTQTDGGCAQAGFNRRRRVDIMTERKRNGGSLWNPIAPRTCNKKKRRTKTTIRTSHRRGVARRRSAEEAEREKVRKKQGKEDLIRGRTNGGLLDRHHTYWKTTPYQQVL